MKAPIPDPFETTNSPALEAETRVFRQSFWRVYFAALLSSAVHLVFLSVLLWFVLTSSPAASWLLILLSIPVVMPLLQAANATIFQSIEVNRFGIKQSHRLNFVEWSQIKSARYFWTGTFIAISIQGWGWFK